MRKLIVLLLFVFICPVIVVGQSQEKVYASMLISFARGIKQPARSACQQYVIGVLEYGPLVAELDKMLLKMTIDGKRVKVVQLKASEPVPGLDLVFIPAYKARSLESIAKALAGKPTLIVTNKVGLARRGSDLNFILIDGKLHYEINCDKIEGRGMKIAAAIRSLGIDVSS